MKKCYLLVCFFAISLFAYTQTSSCEDANYYITSAYSHVKSSYDSNNVSHLKYYAKRSLESYTLSNDVLPSCNCSKAVTLKDKAIEFLAKVENTETFEDGRYFIKRAREVAQQAIDELDICADANYTEPEQDTAEVDDSNDVASVSTNSSTTSNSSGASSSLSDLERKQKELLRQQEELQRKTAALKAKMANEEQMQLKKQKELLASSYRKTIDESIKNYNITLKQCQCNTDNVTQKGNYLNISEKSVNEIKTHYINLLESATSDYLEKLNSCKS